MIRASRWSPLFSINNRNKRRSILLPSILKSNLSNSEGYRSGKSPLVSASKTSPKTGPRSQCASSSPDLDAKIRIMTRDRRMQIAQASNDKSKMNDQKMLVVSSVIHRSEGMEQHR
jgi:hypothetical protein